MIALLVGVHAFIGLGMIAFGWFQGSWGSDYVGGMMGHRNLWGSYLAAAIFFPMWMVLYEKGIWRMIGIAAFGLAIPAIILSFSRSAWLAMLVGFFVWGLIFFLSENDGKNNSRKLFAGIGLLILGMSVGTYFLADESSRAALSDRANTIITANIDGDESKESTGSIVFRMKTWKQSWDIIKSNPLMGIGLGNWKKEIPKYGTGSYMESSGLIMRAKPHNEIVGIGSEMGLIGIGLSLIHI